MNILFVDDEKVIREGMRTFIDWKKIGCEHLYIAASASQAMKILEKHLVDLVISDIYMQKTSGIEFAKQLKEHYSSIKIILLSAYESFDYAREAIEAGVLKYLLKPVSPEELEESILAVKKQLSEESELSGRMIESEKMAQVYQPLLTEDFWKSLLLKEMQKETGSSEADRMIEDAEQFIQKNYNDETLNVNKVAEYLHVNTSYFSRTFKKKCGITCIEYISNIRIEVAKMLLKETNLKHHQIAQAVGYSNVYYFGAHFKKITGETPGQYRKKVESRHV